MLHILTWSECTNPSELDTQLGCVFESMGVNDTDIDRCIWRRISALPSWTWHTMETLRPDTKMSHACKRSSHRGVGLSWSTTRIKFKACTNDDKNKRIYTESVNEMGRIARQVVSLTNTVDHFTEFIVKYKEIPRVVIVEKFSLGQMVLEIVYLYIYIYGDRTLFLNLRYDIIIYRIETCNILSWDVFRISTLSKFILPKRPLIKDLMLAIDRWAFIALNWSVRRSMWILRLLDRKIWLYVFQGFT